MEEIERMVEQAASSEIKAALVEASRLCRDYARPSGDRASEQALHQEMNVMLDELRARGNL